MSRARPRARAQSASPSTISVPSGSVANVTSSSSIPGASETAVASHSRMRGMPWMPGPPQRGVVSTGAGSSTRISASRASRRCSGSLRKKRTTTRLDQAVVAVVSAVEDVDLARFEVAEDEEVVADQLELEDRLLGRHRVERELLLLHDHGVLLGRSGWLVGAVAAHAARARGAPSAGSAPPVARACRRAGRSRRACPATPRGPAGSGPFVHTVASATWLSAIDGFFSTASSTSTCVGSASCFASFPTFRSRVVPDRPASPRRSCPSRQAASRLLEWIGASS